jgi:hypothetical protein
VKLEIGTESFATKADAIAYYQQMLHRYDIGAWVNEADTAQLRALLDRHPTREQKVGAGVAGFSVTAAPYNNRGFLLRRVDGTTTDFSYRKCIDAPPTARDRLHDTLRHEVADDILRARYQYLVAHGDTAGQVSCALTGAMITLAQSHADHAPPFTFHVLATTIVLARKLVASEALLTPPADNQLGRLLCDRELAADWISYHHQLAHLRIVAADENVRRAQMAMPRAIDRQLILEHWQVAP